MIGSALCHPHSETQCEADSMHACVIMIAKAEKLNMTNCRLTPKVPT